MRTETENKEYVNRLRRIEGQMKGVENMLEDGRPCEEVAMQLLAIQNAVRNVSKLLIKNHLSHCVKDGIEKGNDTVVEEFCSILDKYI